MQDELEFGLSNVRILKKKKKTKQKIGIIIAVKFYVTFFLQEKPRNHLDLRHRLDSKGQRKGKLIDYRYSFYISFFLLGF